MKRSFGGVLLGLGLLSCTSSSGGGGGLGDNAATNMAGAVARCSLAWRCKGMPLGDAANYPGAVSEADCVAKIRADDMKEPQGDLPCPVGQMLNPTLAQTCLAQLNSATCTANGEMLMEACSPAKICVAKTAGAGGSGGSGLPGQGGSLGGGFGGSPGGTGGGVGTACTTCATQACPTQLAACMADTECRALALCLGGCSNTTCQQTCASTHPNGLRTVQPYLLCAVNACNAICGGSMPGMMGTGGVGGTPPGTGGSGGEVDPCDACVETNCKTQLSACLSPTSPCGKIVQCAQGCTTGNAACLQQCAATNPAGLQAATALSMCQDSFCAAACQ